MRSLPLISWTIQKRKIKDLKPHPKNPRKLSKHDGDKLKESLTEFGLIDKPIITTDDLIIGGHQRIAVLKKMGAKEVECHVPDREMTEKEIDKLNIMLNRVHGEFDYDILANMFDETLLFEAGFTQEELSFDDVSGEEQSAEAKSEKKTKTCPSCGHEFWLGYIL